ncbi:uncharacterized protein Dana_GF17871 [Drosophila ananassae]|uniref:DNA polymerase theta n=1 Tax=Drosophila ananassae TaxID=7217 RepID=B3M1V8_DROAN|nr:DNA polymerase theta [Drosophila ananassae]EDV42218.1 uncharacterized protein Dana_GF17871 [Drosophila ananassae]
MDFSQSLNFGNSTLLQLEKGIQDAGKDNDLHANASSGKHVRDTTGNIEDNYSDFFKSDFSIVIQKSDDPFESQPHFNVSHIEAILGISHNECGKPLSPTTINSRLCSEDVFGDEDEEQAPQPEPEEHPTTINSHLCSEDVFGDEDEEKAPQPEPEENLDESSFLAPVRDQRASEQLKVDIMRSCMVAKQGELHDVSKITQNLSSMSPGQLKLSPDSFSQVDYAQKKKSSAAPVPVDLQSLKSIFAWNLPPSISAVYKRKGVVQMFDWQVECLSKRSVLFDHCNLVYSAPTSAGKTLVSEILLIKTVLERRKKVLLILPFISVVREKMFYLQDLLVPAGYRVEGFFGGYNPPGGFENIDVAICTIEKANSIVNKLLEQDKLDSIGTVVVDEVHLISDKGRGYILELLLAKILYMSRRKSLQIQVITMSATLANVQLLQRWLDAELYITDYRPVALKEMIKVGTKVFDNQLQYVRDVSQQSELQQALGNDSDHVAQLCIETLLEGCSVIVFCPSKDWCENLAVQLATAMHALIKSGSDLGRRLRSNLSPEALENVKQQLRDIPTGLDAVMSKAVTCACAFHHAGLTTEERDIVETAFKSGALKVLVATSTLSSGVNLPARRVLIRSPLFGGKQMSSLTYRQMIGRAGRTGKDTLGESILICTESNARIGRELVTAQLQPISSCLEMDGSTHLKRALLEVISSGVATTRQDIDRFVNCTLLSAQKAMKNDENPVADEESDSNYINDALDFLIEYEFIRLQTDEETETSAYVATRLGAACLASSMPPTDGLLLFAELQKSRRCFVLESELHAVYLVTPYTVCYQLQDLDWLIYLDMWEKLNPAMKKVGELVGVKESFLVKAMRGQTNLDYKQMQVHKRFYTALALQELVNETPINVVVHKFKCHRGMLQTLQQMASTFAGIVTAFCTSLQWSTLALIVSEFRDRLYFGIHSDLIDLMRLPDLTQKRARALFDAGFKNLVQLAGADVLALEKVLFNSLSFDSAKQHDHENAEEAAKRNMVRNFFITGKAGMTVAEAAKLLISEARQFVQYEFGAGSIKWTQEQPGETEQKLEDGATEANMKVPLNDSTTKRRKSKKNLKLIEENENRSQQQAPLKRMVSEEQSIALILSPPKQPKVASANEPILQPGMIDTNSQIASLGQTWNQPSTSTVPVQQTRSGSTEKVQILNCLEIAPNGAVTERVFQNLPQHILTGKPSPLKQTQSMASKRESKQKTPKKPEVNKTGTSSNGLVPENPILNPQELLKKEVEERKRIAQMKMNQKLEQMQNQRQTPVGSTMTVMDAYPKKGLVEPTSLMPLQTDAHDNRKSPSSSDISVSVGSSSEASNTTSRTSSRKGSAIEEDLFLSDDSFMMSSGVTAALTAVERKTPLEVLPETDEIPSSQPKEPETVAPLTPHASRLIRSHILRTQRLQSSPRSITSHSSTSSSSAQGTEGTDTSDASSAVECSDFTLENSLFKHPLELNASYVLSCPTDVNNASSLTKISITDVCESNHLFEIATKKLSEATTCGLSVGLKSHAGNSKPLIGANLLINQMGELEQGEATNSQILFQVDDSTYIDCLSFCVDSHYVVHFKMQEEKGRGVSTSLKLQEISKIFARTDLTLVMHKTKDQLKVILQAIPELKTIAVKFEDPNVASWLMQPDRNCSFQNMCQQYAPECLNLLNLCGSGLGYTSYGLDASSEVSAQVRAQVEACVSVHILNGQMKSLEEHQFIKVFRDNEMPLCLILAQMEVIGFPVKEHRLGNLISQIAGSMKKLEAKIFELNGSRFNINSSQAVAKVLGIHRKPTGRVSTSREVLERLEAPIANLICQYRKLNALLVKNVQPLMKCCLNNRIHGHSITNTATGRISMAEPNLQNVAKNFVVDVQDRGAIVSCRSAFMPMDSTRCLLSADFCQLEMRILAHLSQDKALVAAMNSPRDIFTSISAHWHRMNESEVSDQLREGTKKICYGIIYGMSMRKLADELNVTEQEAEVLSEQFHSNYPGIRSYTNRLIKYARHKGYVETITGRRRYLENIRSEDAGTRKKAERQAVNSTIQGSAADIAKVAIIKSVKYMRRHCQKLFIDENSVNLVLHIHDELMFEVPADKAKKIAKLLKVVMEASARLTVPLKVKLKMGSCWGNLEEIKV